MKKTEICQNMYRRICMSATYNMYTKHYCISANIKIQVSNGVIKTNTMLSL